MSGRGIEPVSAVISYVETHLNEKLDLDTVANAAGYSKYHLHRMFTETVGLTLHDYIQRRRLTGAAERLAGSEKPLIEIAMAAGYESQQAFTAVFKAMYKKTPAEFRQSGVFYPLLLEFVLEANPSDPDAVARAVSYASPEDLPDWKRFVPLVIGGFPGLEEEAHLERVKRYMEQRQALIVRDGPAIIGAAAFSRRNGSVDFLAVHPQYRRGGTAKALLGFLMGNLPAGREISITTFREGDRADTGQRAEYKRLGFTEAELLTEFGYPTQRLVMLPGQEGNRHE